MCVCVLEGEVEALGKRQIEEEEERVCVYVCEGGGGGHLCAVSFISQRLIRVLSIIRVSTPS